MRRQRLSIAEPNPYGNTTSFPICLETKFDAYSRFSQHPPSLSDEIHLVIILGLEPIGTLVRVTLVLWDV